MHYLECLGLKVGKKSNNAGIPPSILSNSSLADIFLRGLADTDFSMCFKKGNRKNNSYPGIIAEFASGKIIEDIQIILDNIGITYCKQIVNKKNSFSKFTHYRLEINGKRNLNLWIKFIGFSNPKHLTKIKVWKKLGYCPPRATYSERMKILGEE
ncbi:hypothetical protein GF336_01435 [Candidatus Woesearchaeota archaeon]|nr:hypothetical protein [Candidatus Woesearchaeota archaeon]